MIEAQLGLPIDIHGGGIDLTFPHHENELAQGRCAHGASSFANYWMHNGFLDMAGVKMSKSLGNVIIPHELLQHAPGEAVRWALLSAHYRQPLDWTGELVEQSRRSLDRLYGALHRSAELEAPASNPPREFMAALGDDLNTPQATAVLFSVAGEIERALNAGDKAAAAKAKASLLAAGALLGVLQTDPDSWFKGAAGDDLKDKVEALLAQRIEARAAKDWPTADRIRGELDALGVVVMDGPAGATWRLKE
jgi:cysteinyl-tRNA synthetase